MNIEKARRIIRNAKRADGKYSVDDFKFVIAELEICLTEPCDEQEHTKRYHFCFSCKTNTYQILFPAGEYICLNCNRRMT